MTQQLAPATDRRVVSRPDVRRADRVMRRILRIPTVDRSVAPGAHRAFRLSLVVSGVRCLVTYLAVPLLVPLVSFAGFLSAPLGILLCGVAFVSGIAGVRRFWRADHRHKWTYTWFMAAVFVILIVALSFDVLRLIQS